MKSTLAQSLFVTALAVLVLSYASATKLFGKVHVIIQSNILIERLSTHCYSSDVDFGVHTLGEGQALRFSFTKFLLTKYYCYFWTPHGSGQYGVFTNRMDKMCNGYCMWYIREDGPCLRKTNGELYCQGWNIPQIRPPPRSTSTN